MESVQNKSITSSVESESENEKKNKSQIRKLKIRPKHRLGVQARLLDDSVDM